MDKKRILHLLFSFSLIATQIIGCTGPSTTPEVSDHGVTTVEIRYKDVDGTEAVGITEISVFKLNDGGCEYRLEYNPADRVDWPIGEVAGDQGDPQRQLSETCTPEGFTKTMMESQREFEEQTVYYWVKEAREYAIKHFWITPPNWDDNPIAYDNALLVPDVLTQASYNDACKFIEASEGCMRAWAHEASPKIHIKAGMAEAELIAHEFGHYAAGFIFGHMNITFVPGFNVGFDLLNCEHRSFNETIAEMFMSLFLHNARYAYYSAQNPVTDGVPNSSFYLKNTMEYSTDCGSSDYIMGRPLVQASHKMLWDNVWQGAGLNEMDANLAMVNAFTASLAKTRGYDIYQLAIGILDYLEQTQPTVITNKAKIIFLDHGFGRFGEDAEVGVDTEYGNGTYFESAAQVGESGEIGDSNVFGSGSQVGNFVIIGNHNVFEANLQIGDFANIGDNNILGTGLQFGNNLTVGNQNFVGAWSHFGNDITIGDNNTIGNVDVGNNVEIGDHVTIEDGVTIGNNVVVENCAIIEADAVIGTDVKILINGRIEKDFVVPDKIEIGGNPQLVCPP